MNRGALSRHGLSTIFDLCLSFISLICFLTACFSIFSFTGQAREGGGGGGQGELSPLLADCARSQRTVNWKGLYIMSS